MRVTRRGFFQTVGVAAGSAALIKGKLAKAEQARRGPWGVGHSPRGHGPVRLPAVSGGDVGSWYGRSMARWQGSREMPSIPSTGERSAPRHLGGFNSSTIQTA